MGQWKSNSMKKAYFTCHLDFVGYDYISIIFFFQLKKYFFFVIFNLAKMFIIEHNFKKQLNFEKNAFVDFNTC